MRKAASVVVLAVALCFASAAVAQTVIETKVKSGTVIGKTDHSVVIRMDDGIVREFEVPPGRTATVDGKEVGLADLKIGTTLTATFKTITQPVVVKTATIKDGEVVKYTGAVLTTREKDGFHTYVVPKGFKFLVDGKETGMEGLHTGMKLNATIVTTSTETTTATKREGVTGKAPAEPTAVMAAAPPAPTPTTPAPAPMTAAAPAAAPKKAPAAPETAAATPAPAAPEPTVAAAPVVKAEAPTPEPPAGASRTTTIVIGLIVLLLLIVLVILGTKKDK